MLERELAFIHSLVYCGDEFFQVLQIYVVLKRDWLCFVGPIRLEDTCVCINKVLKEETRTEKRGDNNLGKPESIIDYNSLHILEIVNLTHHKFHLSLQVCIGQRT